QPRPLVGAGGRDRPEEHGVAGQRQQVDGRNDQRSENERGDDPGAQQAGVYWRRPKRRCRSRYQAIAAARSSPLKAGQKLSVKYSSVYAKSQSRKLLMRASPPVRMHRSGGGRSPSER